MKEITNVVYIQATLVETVTDEQYDSFEEIWNRNPKELVDEEVVADQLLVDNVVVLGQKIFVREVDE